MICNYDNVISGVSHKLKRKFQVISRDGNFNFYKNSRSDHSDYYWIKAKGGDSIKDVTQRAKNKIRSTSRGTREDASNVSEVQTILTKPGFLYRVLRPFFIQLAGSTVGELKVVRSGQAEF